MKYNKYYLYSQTNIYFHTYTNWTQSTVHFFLNARTFQLMETDHTTKIFNRASAEPTQTIIGEICRVKHRPWMCLLYNIRDKRILRQKITQLLSKWNIINTIYTVKQISILTHTQLNTNYCSFLFERANFPTNGDGPHYKDIQQSECGTYPNHHWGYLSCETSTVVVFVI